ncbi:hypothetical protein JW868_01715 [Candidatus Woesearchaeota archaeon]|nr:hypothetical protein [Candidatus Woesearchaeota archaeon]
MPKEFELEEDELAFGLDEEPILEETNYELKKLRIIAVIVILTVIIIVGFTLLYFSMKNATKEIEVEVKEDIVVLKNNTIRDYKELDISFEDYINNSQAYEGQVVEVTGFLFKKLIPSSDRGGYYEEFIVDYHTNLIRLKDLTARQRLLFETGKRSELHYNVTGIFHKSFTGPEISVQYIYESERPIELIEHIETYEENETLTRYETKTVPKYPWLQ